MSTTFQRRIAHLHRSPRRQRGAVAILVGVAIFVLIGMLGIVMDLGHLYVRKTELQNAADAAALAGVKQFDGKATGIDAAVAAAIAIAAANASDFGKTAVAISEAQIRFNKTSPDVDDPGWVSAATAKADVDVARYTFIKVDTNGIAQETRATWFMPLVNPALASTRANGVAVSACPTCDGLPMFICARDALAPPNYGFKPGQAYLLHDVPGGPGPGNVGYFDPVAPGSPGLISGSSDMQLVVCQGKTSACFPGTYTSLTQPSFNPMADALNTRFDDFSKVPAKLKDPAMCRPDTNIRPFPYASSTWMLPNVPGCQSEDNGCALGLHWSAVRPDAPGAALPVPPVAYLPTGTPYTQMVTAPADLLDAAPERRIVTMAMVTNCIDASGKPAINGGNKPVVVAGFAHFFLPVKAVGTGSQKGVYAEFIDVTTTARGIVPECKLYR